MTTRKDEFGEVFTPPTLVDELLNALPAAVWRDPTHRFLDPCAGEGAFVHGMVARLMQGLATVMKNEQTRRRHILGRMITMYDLNPANVRALRRTFGQEAQIERRDFLAAEGGTVPAPAWDVVVANPPFQTPKHATYTGAAGNRTLWDKFLVHALAKVSPRGYVAFITPANWRRPDHPLYPVVTRQNTLLYLHVYDKAAGKTLFGVQSRFDLYVIQQGASTHPCHVVDQDGQLHRRIDPKAWPFLPNASYPLVKSYLKRGPPNTVIHDAGMYDARTLGTRKTAWPVVHTMTREGVGILFAKSPKAMSCAKSPTMSCAKSPTMSCAKPGTHCGHFGVPKVILNFNEHLYPLNDWRGEYGMSQLSFGLPVKNKKEGDALIRRLMSPEFQEVLRVCKWSAFQTDHRMFRYMNL